MKSMKILVVLLSLQFVTTLLIGCSDNDDDEQSSECFPSESWIFIGTITDINATITSSSCGDFSILPDNPIEGNMTGVYSTCSLPDSFKSDGTKVVFSGRLLDPKGFIVDMCADPLEITEIRLSE